MTSGLSFIRTRFVRCYATFTISYYDQLRYDFIAYILKVMLKQKEKTQASQNRFICIPTFCLINMIRFRFVLCLFGHEESV